MCIWCDVRDSIDRLMFKNGLQDEALSKVLDTFECEEESDSEEESESEEEEIKKPTKKGKRNKR